MSSKIDLVISQLDEVLMRLHRIERLIDFGDEEAPEDVKAAFDRVFGKSAGKPKLTIVKPEKENNVVEFDPK